MAKGGTVVAQEIGLTESEALSASLAALGLDAGVIGVPVEDRILSEYRRQITTKRRLVPASEVALAIGMNQTTVTAACRRMVDRGRMLRTVNPNNSRVAYVPKAEG